MKNYKNLKLELLNHDAVRITTDKNVCLYIDPFKLPASPEPQKADIVLITHPHHDHCSLEDLMRIVTPKTIIVCVADAQSKVLRLKFGGLHVLSPSQSISLPTSHTSFTVQAVPAYNIGKEFHPKDNQWVGYIITIDGTSVYHTGDTDIIPEMKLLKNIDVAFVPVSGTYVMTAKEAAQAVALFSPKLVIPMHYGAIVGSLSDAREFEQLVKKSSPTTDICILLH